MHYYKVQKRKGMTLKVHLAFVTFCLVEYRICTNTKLGELLKPTRIFMSNLKMYSIFNQMQNQPKRVVKVLCNLYDKKKMYFTIMSLVSLHVIERSLHICRSPKKSTA